MVCELYLNKTIFLLVRQLILFHVGLDFFSILHNQNLSAPLRHCLHLILEEAVCAAE